MKTKNWLILSAFLAFLGYAAFLYSKKQDALELEADALLGCIDRPVLFKKWNEFNNTDWGAYADAIEKHLNISRDDKNTRAYIAGFFKAINVEPRSAYVKWYKNDILKWLKSNKSLPHWDIEIGILNCKS